MLANPQKILAHLRRIAILRDPFQNPQSLKNVQDYFISELESYGYAVEEQSFQEDGFTFCNFLARKPKEIGMPKFIVGAHFDAVPGSPGADDNASGVACMLEAARLFAEAGFSQQGVQFAAFNLEEYGMRGSAEHAKFLNSRMLPEEKKNFKGMISLEMVGYTSKKPGSQKVPPGLQGRYPDTGDFLALVGEPRSRRLLETAKNAYQNAELPVQDLLLPLKGEEFPEARLSDHSSFWDKDFPALLVTDTSFFRNPNYHMPGDTIETLDLDFMTKVAQGTYSLLKTVST